jgi:DNA polymerase/3'-5' exonuclease PolX
MHDMVREYDPQGKIVGHPSLDKTHEVDRCCDEEREPKGHLERNRDIVAEVDLMIATPHQETEQQRGGTWYTVRQAKKAIKSGTAKCKKLYVVKPNGKVDYFDFDKLQD